VAGAEVTMSMAMPSADVVDVPAHQLVFLVEKDRLEQFER